MKRTRLRTLALGLLTVGSLTLPSSDAFAWQTNLNSPSRYDRALAVAVDADGDVVAAGVNPEFAVVKLAGTNGRRLWRHVIAGYDAEARVAAVTASGDVVAAGTASRGDFNSFTVVKLGGVNGAELWSYEIDGAAVRSSDRANAVAVDVAGDVIAAGKIEHTTLSPDFIVVKLDGGSGTELWRREINGTADGSWDRASAVAVDAAGDVMAGGRTDNIGGMDFTVVKLRSADGIELWRHDHDIDTGVAGAIAVDASGDVLAAGDAVVKLRGSDGVELWRVSDLGAGAVVVDADGNVVAAGEIDSDFAVVKLRGSDGQELWRQVVDGTANDFDKAAAVAVDADGDVVAGGRIEAADTLTDFAVFKFRGTDGQELWRHVIDGTAADTHFSIIDEALAVTLDAAGNVVAAGQTENKGPEEHFTVVKLSERLTGAVLRVRDRDGNPERRALAVRSRDQGLFVADPGGAGDPTLSGGDLELINPTTGETATFDLPAANWEELPGGYRYRDRSREAGPCRTVVLKRDRVLTASCKGAQIGFSLDEPSQGTLGVKLTTGSDSVRYCMEFGGTIVKDTPAAAGRTGSFKAKKAPVPTACPDMP
jgi:hypothetical protein